MPETIGTDMASHVYPPILFRSGVFLRAFHAAAHALTLRNWYVRRRLRRLVDGLSRGATVVDIGCGAGDHLFYALRRRPDLNVIGIDRSPASVQLCRNYAKALDAPAEFICGNVDDEVALPPADLLVCITALQYVADDAALLKKARKILRSGGRLLAYVPVRNSRLTTIYRRVVEGSPMHYDTVNRRKRIYSVEDVRATMEAAGFEVSRFEQAYGTFGKIYFETYELLLHGLARSPGRILFLPLALVLSPVLFCLMLLDFALPVRTGNGLLLEAR